MLSAVKPSNVLTLGNYIGAIKNWVTMQKDYDCIFFAVDLHTITKRIEGQMLRDQTYYVIAAYIAAGLDPEKVTLFTQSHVPAHTELSWIMTCFCQMGELNRMTQYKDLAAKAGASIGAGIFNYPTLMASDILLYQTHLVPVGEDQKQHVELTRDIAIRMNGIYGDDLFRVPEPWIPKVGARIMDLQDPTAKMGKSDSQGGGAVYLSDSDKEIEKKVKRATTDSGTEITDDDAKPGIKNLLTIQSAITGKPISELVASYSGRQYGHLKVETAEIVVQAVKPIREKTDALLKDRTYLDEILKKGADKAASRAERTLAKVYDRVGFIPKKT